MSEKTLIPEFNVAELRNELKEMKVQVSDMIKNDPEYSGELDLFMCVIDNLNGEIGNIKAINELDYHKQARVLADISLFQAMLTQMFDEQGEYADEEEEEECGDDCGHHHH